MRPFTPLMSPPALPMKTKPFQAIGAAGALSPFFGSPDLGCQDALAGLDTVGKTRGVWGAAERNAVKIGRPAFAFRRCGGCVVLMRPPVLAEGGRIEEKISNAVTKISASFTINSP